MQDFRLLVGCSIHHLAKVMAAALKKHGGKGIPFDEYRKIKPRYEKALKLVEVGWYSEAENIFEDIIDEEFEPEPPMAKTAKEKIEEIKETTETRLEELKQKIKDGEKDEAIVGLYILKARCKSMDIETDINMTIAELEKDKSLDKEVVQKAKKESQACGLYLKAEGYLADGEKKRARSYFSRIEKSYEESSFYEKALEKLSEIEEE